MAGGSMTPKIFKELYEAHSNYWDGRRAEMRRLRNVYANRYWDKTADPSQILIEVPRAYEYVEGFIASLYARNPAVVVKADLRGRGVPQKVQSLANEFLIMIRTVLEDVSRLALIYPNAFLKLSYTANPDPFKRVRASVVAPWDCIVDLDGASWTDQSFVAHRYYIREEEAKERFGNKRFGIKPMRRFLDDTDEGEGQSIFRSYDADREQTQSVFNYVEIVEVYAIDKNKFYVWSPDWNGGSKWLQDGIEIEVGEEDNINTEKFNEIPFTDGANQPVAPIIPLYFSRMPELPLRGYSALRRIYDQIVETNVIRTYQASMVRRSARQWIVEKGVYDDIALSKIAQGHDGEFIEVQLSQGQTLQASILPMPHSPVPTELENYFQNVQEDLAKGSLQAAFTRGEAVNTTATEALLLASYSSTEQGRCARELHASIENTAKVYISMMKTFLGDDTDIILLNGQPEPISYKDLDGDFGFFAQESGSTPISEAIKKSEFMNLTQMLAQMGVPPQKILKEIIRLFDLDESLLPEVTSSADAEMPQPSPSGVQSPQVPPDMPIMSGKGASPQDVEPFLPQGQGGIY